MVDLIPVQLTVKPCGGVSLTRRPRHARRSVSAPETAGGNPEKGNNRGLAVKLTDDHPPEPPKKKRAPRGSKGLSSEAKSKLVFACRYLQERYGKTNLRFWTATVPNNDPKKLQEILQKNRQILKTLRDRFVKYLKRRGLPTEIVIVAELQQRGALHYHAAFVGKAGKNRVVYEEMDKLWEHSLRCHVDLPQNARFDVACRCEEIKKDVGRYLAKYLSKSISKETAITQGISITWYSIGTVLTRLYYELLDSGKFAAEVTYSFFDYVQTLLSSFLIAPSWVTRDGWALGIKGYDPPNQTVTSFLWQFPLVRAVFFP